MQVVHNQHVERMEKLAWHSSTYGLKLVGNGSVILYQLYEKSKIPTPGLIREWRT